MPLLKLAVLSLLTLSLTMMSYSQNKGIGTIKGSVVDEATRRPLEFVNVVLRSAGDSSIVTGTVSDKNGKFDIENVTEGDYQVTFSLISYKEKKTPSFKIDPQHSKLNVGTVLLVETTVSLDEVLITSQKTLLNNAIDRKVYNVDQDIMSKAGSASELLQNVPSVEVDIDGNVSLRGSTNVLILINGKNSPLMGKSRAEVLQDMPANSIEKIEVITNPSAKYKPDGTAGIINLVLKKNTSRGLNGGITANGGNRDRENASARLNYNSGSMNIYGNLGVRKDSRTRTNTDGRVQLDSLGNTSLYNQYLTSNSRPFSTIMNLGSDFALDPGNSFGIAGNYFHNSFTRIEVAKTVVQTPSYQVTSDYDRDRHDDEHEEEYGFTSFYQHNFSTEDHKLRLEVKSSNAPEQQDNHYTTLYRVPGIPNEYDNTLVKQGEKHSELSLDYSYPMGDHSTFEAGYGGELSNYTFDLHAEYFDALQQKFFNDATKSNRFLFDEGVHALYATYSEKLGQLSVLAGLRTEKGSTTSNLVTSDSVVSNDYFTLYPTVHLSYELNDAAELQLNYSKRIHRPELDDMNPFPQYQDPRTLNAGNPHLLPEYTHSVELGCKLQNDYLSVLPSVYYRYTYNQFTTITQALNDTVVLRTHTNLSNAHALGAELIFSGSVNELLTTNLSANVFREQIDASNLGYSANKSVTSWTGALTCNVNITRTTMMQVNSRYNSARLTPQGEYTPSYVVNLGFRQALIENKLSLVVTAADIFKTSKRDITLTIPSLTQNVVNKRDAQILYVGLTYLFGTPPKAAKDEPLKYEDGM